MPKKYRSPYPPEFRRQIVELARTGRSGFEFAQEFEPSYWTIHQWIKQADRDEGVLMRLLAETYGPLPIASGAEQRPGMS